MFKKIILLLCVVQLCAYNVPITYHKQSPNASAQSQQRVLTPREVFIVRQKQVLDLCKMYPLKVAESQKIVEFGTKMTTVEEVLACSEAAMLYAKSFARLNKNDQKKFDSIKDELLGHVDDVLFNKTNIPHDKIFNQLYKAELISKEEFENLTGIASKK